MFHDVDFAMHCQCIVETHEKKTLEKMEFNKTTTDDMCLIQN